MKFTPISNYDTFDDRNHIDSHIKIDLCCGAVNFEIVAVGAMIRLSSFFFLVETRPT